MARGEGRAAARLAAVQALYQMEVAGSGLNEVFAEFEAHWIGQEVEGDHYKPAETAFFRNVVQGVQEHQAQLDAVVDEALRRDWPLSRIEMVLRAILRAGAYELGHRGDVPGRVIISEYADVAGAFFGREEVGMANGVLDRIAKALRPDEFTSVGVAG